MSSTNKHFPHSRMNMTFLKSLTILRKMMIKIQVGTHQDFPGTMPNHRQNSNKNLQSTFLRQNLSQVSNNNLQKKPRELSIKKHRHQTFLRSKVPKRFCPSKMNWRKNCRSSKSVAHIGSHPGVNFTIISNIL